LYKPSPHPLHENAHAHPSQQTDDNARDEFDRIVIDLFRRNLRDGSAEQTREGHGDQDAEYFNRYISDENTARDFALVIGVSVFFEYGNRGYDKPDEEKETRNYLYGYWMFP
jgi:hypothetical protein